MTDIWKTSGFTKDLLSFIDNADEPAEGAGGLSKNDAAPLETALTALQDNSM